MKDPQQHCQNRQPGRASLTQKRFWAGLLFAVCIASSLSACGFTPGRTAGLVLTLVPTLDLPEPALETSLPSATENPTAPTPAEPVTPAPSASATAALTVTETVTPWVNESPTPGPSPTVTRTPTETRIPTLTRTPSRTPTITFTPTPPEPELYLMRPGLLSKIMSPIQMEVYAVTGAGGNVTIELVGEDGRVISRKVLNRGKDAGRRFWLAPELPFEIDAVAETARLQIFSQDEFGRLITLSSVDLILLSVGRNEISPVAIDQEPYLIRRPDYGESIGGGTLVLEALARTVNDSPLFIELVDERGVVLSVKQLAVPAPTGPLSHTPFRVDIPYKVSGTTPARLVIRQEGSRIPGTVALVSQLVVLEP